MNNLKKYYKEKIITKLMDELKLSNVMQVPKILKITLNIGEGKTAGGRPSCDPWGNPKGKKTRKNKTTDKYIVKTRQKNKEKRGK